jgi:hypothetical protein
MQYLKEWLYKHISGDKREAFSSSDNQSAYKSSHLACEKDSDKNIEWKRKECVICILFWKEAKLYQSY